nr:uncharacterized protein LOC109162678 [Ipomoea batatas]
MHVHATVFNIDTFSSYHLVIFVDIEKLAERRQKRRFMFENAWLRDTGCKDTVLQVWSTKYVLASADKEHWLKAGDRNTKFFHTYATSRRRKNYVAWLKDSSGAWVDKDDLPNLARHYFERIFATTGVHFNDDLSGQSILLRGCFRRIGNGGQTRIWGDPWLPHETEPQLQTPQSDYYGHAMVSALSNLESMDWDVPLLQEMAILSVRSALCRHGVDLGELCPLCGQLSETPMHLFIEYACSNVLWSGTFAIPLALQNDYFESWLSATISGVDMSGKIKCVVMLWSIWKYSNAIVWFGTSRNYMDFSLHTTRSVKTLAFSRWFMVASCYDN